MRAKQTIVCKLCGKECSSVGLSSHLKYKHDTTTAEYISKFGDFRANTKKAASLKAGKSLFKCKICNDDKEYTTVSLSHHLHKVHNTTKNDYVTANLLGGISPRCKCGCGGETKVISYDAPFVTEYCSGHNKSTKGYKFSEKSKALMAQRANERIAKINLAGDVQPWHNKAALKTRSEVVHKKSMAEKSTKFNVTILSEDAARVTFRCNKCQATHSQYHSSYFNCIKCNPPQKSKVQLELFNYIKNELGVDTAVNDHRKSFGGNMELDVFIPEAKIGIEFDELYYHSEVSGKKPKSYHLWKTDECEKLGIRLTHIFEDEWRDKKDIVKSKIQRLLKKSKGVQTIYARKCKVQEINYGIAAPFLNTNHIQGATQSSVFLGLFSGDRLVSVASFGKPTVIRGRKKMEIGEWELTRFSSDIRTSVVGACGKLMSHFIKTKSPSKIISYADKRFTSRESNVYLSIGFKLISESPPNYFYMNDYKHRLHRFNFTKGKLVSSGADKAKTEWQIMQEAGYDRIWDCGHLKFEMNIAP